MKSLLSFLILLYCFNTFGQSEIENLNKKFDEYQEKEQFNGIIIITKNGEILLNRSIGYASFENKIELDSNTPMPLASNTKSFTAMAIMILAEKQKLQFDDPVKKYLKNFPYEDIAIRHLLNNTSGFKRLYKADMNSTQDILKFVVNKKPKLSFLPGERFQYSNLGYSLLAVIVEEISRKSFAEFLDDEIFQSLNMNNSFLLTPENTNREKATCYNEKNKIAEQYIDSYPGGIGIYASANDLIKWDKALYTSQLVPQELILLSYQNGKLNNGSESNYGFGWRKWNGIDNLIFHRGDWEGSESIIFRDIENKVGIIILANRKNEITKWQLMDIILSELGYNE